MSRTFTSKPAVRSQVPTLVALFGPSGGGKTYSALRLATGIQRVVGGEIFVIDTESRRSLHYADKFNFQHVHFASPFGPLDYLAAIEHCVAKGAKTVIIDSLSHEHEGPGGVLEMHAEEVEKKGQKQNALAWALPKGQRRRLINTVLQLDLNVILCFRAKEKLDWDKKPPTKLGWMAIGGEEFLFEMTIGALLMPHCDGVPEWNPQRPGEREMVKLPDQFRDLLPGKQLSEDIGEAMARWASGTPVWVFPKGEHKGKTMDEAPAEYLIELLDKTIPDELRGRVEAEYEKRTAEAFDAAAEGGSE